MLSFLCKYCSFFPVSATSIRVMRLIIVGILCFTNFQLRITAHLSAPIRGFIFLLLPLFRLASSIPHRRSLPFSRLPRRISMREKRSPQNQSLHISHRRLCHGAGWGSGGSYPDVKRVSRDSHRYLLLGVSYQSSRSVLNSSP